MKKSKFLKKSLAMLLALMLVVAMIPLSASAAEYQPTYAVTPVSLSGGTLQGSSPTWSIEFPYNTTPKMTVQLGNAGDRFTVIKADGSEDQNKAADTEITLEFDNNNAPVPFRFYVTNASGDKSQTYTVNWSMAAAATSGSVTSATLDNKYTGRIVGNDITFTVPFGYTGDKDYVVKFEGCSENEKTGTFSGTVGTNKKEATAEVVNNTTQDNVTDLSYNVYVVEETGLESITIGDYEGKFEIATATESDYDKGYETGAITFTIPADLDKDENNELNLVPVLEVGSNYAGATLGGETLTSGKEFDFASLLDGYEKDLVLTSTGTYTRTYSVKFVREGSDTTIDAFTANDETGTVNGTTLSATISSKAELNNVKLAFEGPITFTGAAASTPSITVVGQAGKTATFDSEGKATILGVDCTNPVRLLVKAGDGTTQVYYNLTVTKAASENTNPTISAAKMTITDGDEKTEYTASISGTTITFTVPYSTVDTDVQGAEYTLAKSAFTTTDEKDVQGDFTLKNGGKITATSNDNGNASVYTVKFTKSAAQTGKSISDFVLTDAENINEVGYNNNVDYKVTASGSELKVTVPTGTDVSTLYANFTLSEGAVMYKVPADETTTGLTDKVTADFDSKTGENDSTAAGFTANAKYVIVDETLAYAIANNDTKAATYTQIKNNFAGHYTEYTFKVTNTTLSSAARLTALSADDKAVTSTIGGANADEITLTVPYGYATRNTAFFFDFTVSTGATLSVDGTDLINGGEKNWANGKIVDVEPGVDNIAFQVKYNDSTDKYELYVKDAAVATTTLTVTAQNGTTEKAYEIKEIKVAEGNTGALLTSVKVNNASATINNTAKTVTAALPFGSNLGQVTISLTASTMAYVTVDGDVYDANDTDKTYDLRNPIKIVVQSENGGTTNVYTLKATVAEQFSDVQPGAWYYDNVMAAVEAGIVSGKGDGTFAPMGNITRRDFAIMVTKLLLGGKEPAEATTTPFSDVASNDYALDYIAYCAENGIISGSDGQFRPGDYITRQEAASVMKNALELTGTTSELFADDAKIAGWAKANVYACKAAGIFNGDEKNNFNPTNTLTRAEAASIMVNALNK